MIWSRINLHTLKENPADADIESHRLLVRGGFISKVASGIYVYGPLLWRSIRKFEAIIREELDRIGCCELMLPIVHPAGLWQETGRWRDMGESLLKFKNRSGHEFCLGATHEEVVTDYIRHQVKSYRDLPFSVYQIQTKYRDEIRPRFGLLRCREFIMKDAYSFDLNKESATKTYHLLYDAYLAIFSRLGLEFRVVIADAGQIGGSMTHEFHVLAEAGEDGLMVCDQCDFAANLEVAPCRERQYADIEIQSLEKISTPEVRTIKELAGFMRISEQSLVKTLFFSDDSRGKESKPFAVVVRGDDEVNWVKLKNVLGIADVPRMLTDDEIRNVTGASPGSCGPVGLSIPVYVDLGVSRMPNWIVGANQDDHHLKNVNPSRDFFSQRLVDVRMARADDLCTQCEGRYFSRRGIEVGHVFYLGNKYSSMMKATYLNVDGRPTPIEMGCYGIGVSRTVQAAVEQNRDADGIIWPMAIAPFLVHICLLDPQNEGVRVAAFDLYEKLLSVGIDVFMDDRDERPGVKFKDADLLGMPFRLVMSQRNFNDGQVEFRQRKSGEVSKHSLRDVIAVIQEKMTHH